MARRKKVASVLFTGAAAAAATGVGAGPALADHEQSHWTVTPGGHVTGHNSAPTVFHNEANSASLVCPVSRATASGNVDGTSQTGSSVLLGSISNAVFGTAQSPCTGPFGTTFAAELVGEPWEIWGVDSDSTSNDETTGEIRGIHARVTGVGATTCNFSVTGSTNGGTVPIVFDNTPDAGEHSLSVIADPNATNLHITAVTGGCFGLITSSNEATFAAGYTITPDQTVIHGIAP